MARRAPDPLHAAALLVSLAVLLLGQHDRALLGPDEIRDAGISAAMARTGDVVTPRLGGTPFLEKPPLFHALAAACFRATGSRAPFAARLPAALFGLATLGATYLLARRLGGARYGAITVMVLATTPGFFALAHKAMTDNAISPFVTLAFLALERARADGSGTASRIALGLALAGAFLAKGMVGPAIFGTGAVALLLVEGDLKVLLRPSILAGAVAFAVPVAAWLLTLLAREGIDAVKVVLIDNNIGRALSADADHAAPFWYYGPKLAGVLAQWLPFAAWAAMAPLLPTRLRPIPESAAARSPSRLPSCWLLAGLALLSLASAKRQVYLAPLLPAAALLAARGLEAIHFPSGMPGRGLRAVATALFATACVGLAGAGILDLLRRPDDAGIAIAAMVLAAGAGVAGLLLEFPREAATRLSLVLALAASTLLVGERALAPGLAAYYSYDAVADAIDGASRGREVVLVRPTEGLRGALSVHLDRDLPAIASVGEVPARLGAATGARLLAVVESAPGLDPFAGTGGRVIARIRVRRVEVSLAEFSRD